MSNEVFTAAAILLVAAHLAALGWALLSRRGVRALIALNALVAAAVLAYQATRLPYTLAQPSDERALALIAFEAVALGAALWAFGGRPLPLILSYLAFGLHLCAALFLAWFALTFEMRMF